jgi:hypothetical protein
MRFAVKSLILTGGLVSFGKFLRANLCIFRRSFDSAFSEAFRKHPGPEGSFLLPLVFDFRGGRHIHDVLGCIVPNRRQYGKAVEIRVTH